MGEDIGVFGGPFGVTAGLLEEFGEERVRDTPISEAGFFGAAVGAAMSGMRPIVEVHYTDFLTTAMDPIVNSAAKMRFMSGGRWGVPLVVRAPTGSSNRGPTHGQSLEAWFMNVPGLKVACPATPFDAKGLLIQAIRDDDPVLFFEHRLPLRQPVSRRRHGQRLGTDAIVGDPRAGGGSMPFHSGRPQSDARARILRLWRP